MPIPESIAFSNVAYLIPIFLLLQHSFKLNGLLCPLNKTDSATIVSHTLPSYLNPHSNNQDKSNFKL